MPAIKQKSVSQRLSSIEDKIASMEDKIDRILGKLDEHSKELKKHSKELKVHSKELKVHSKELKVHSKELRMHGKELKSHTKKFTEYDRKFIEHDHKFERAFEILAEHTRRMDTFMTKTEFYEFKDEIYTKLDAMMVILQRLDQERVFTNHDIDRHETMLVSLNTKVGLPHLN